MFPANQGILNPNHWQDIPCLKLIMHAKQQPQMQNDNIGMEEEEAVGWNVLRCVNLWVKIWNARLKLARTAGAIPRGERNKMAAVFTDFLTQ